MEIITEIHTDDLLNILKTGTDNNIKHFINQIGNNYYLFEQIIKIILLYDYENEITKNLIENIANGFIYIIDSNQLNEIDNENILTVSKIGNENLYLVIE